MNSTKLDFNCVMINNLHSKLLTYWYIPYIEEVFFPVNTGKPDVSDECTSFLCTSEPNHTYITYKLYSVLGFCPYNILGLQSDLADTNSSLLSWLVSNIIHMHDCLANFIDLIMLCILINIFLIILYDRYIRIGRGWLLGSNPNNIYYFCTMKIVQIKSN